ncbi:RNA-binding protein Jag [Halalkalibacter wakoensis JCM 9140]|uniref:RNA-binding protein KhpB n=1 Tax=Halalkalibacter wakoensis JCM 9140 TaxID=1236970 RepID=W4Q399_9BACI|nr:RNA-binding cell elongation regulator Jag/EloR [Halalkalibacter wakoensis]GAE26203.1 RNA-binding protein Jag [Halalkalibacter wakoensis JCM 9140]
MTPITVLGKTVDEAIANAVNELQTTREKLSYRIIEEPQKGFLGIIGSKPAKIEAHVLPDPVELAQNFLKETVRLMGQETTIEKTDSRNRILFDLSSSSDSGRLIGKRGQTLEALEYLTNLVCNRGEQSYTRIELDIENYRERRKQTLEQLAMKVAKRAKQSGQSMPLEAMNALERKIIHETLKSVEGVRTESEGKGANRHIVIMPSK